MKTGRIIKIIYKRLKQEAALYFFNLKKKKIDKYFIFYIYLLFFLSFFI